MDTRFKQKYFFNDHYFDVIDNEAKAYFLGLIYADGCIMDNRNFRILLEASDFYIIDKFVKLLEINKEAKLIKRKYKGEYREYVDFGTSNKVFYNSLVSKGVKENKSIFCEFPTKEQVPKEYINHFIRGVFDGDGCVGIYGKKKTRLRINISGTSELLTEICNILHENNINSRVSKYKGKNCYQLQISDNNQAIEFCKFIYKNSDTTLCLKRKSIIYNNYLNRIILPRDRKISKIVQLTLDGEFIKEYLRVSDITKELGFPYSSIKSCCRGERKFSNGFKWMHKIDYDNNKRN